MILVFQTTVPSTVAINADDVYLESYEGGVYYVGNKHIGLQWPVAKETWDELLIQLTRPRSQNQ